jgi:hypothetical protein
VNKILDIQLKERFSYLWRKYFNDAELPITFYYTDGKGNVDLVKSGSIPRCIIAAMANVRKGSSYCFDVESIGCFGGRKWVGFTETIRPDFEYFLSCGLPGKVEGERYKKSPELVRQMMMNEPIFKAPARYIVFKRWDRLEESDNPEVVIFFVGPDVLSGLFTLANFDESDLNGVVSPMGSGCFSIIQYPYMEGKSGHPRGVIGLFDPSARPFVSESVLTFSIPMKKFVKMVDNAEESFLTTRSWRNIQKRIHA